MFNSNITSCQYVNSTLTGEVENIKAVIDGVVWAVPLDLDNTTYAEIMRQVEAGELTIQEADS